MIKRNIPNLLTLGNLFLGCLAIIYILEGEVTTAFWLVIASAVLDFSDGFIARLLNAQSEIGKQLDSLADMVTFGVVPSFFMVHMMGEVLDPASMGIFDVAPAFLIVVFASLRLAIFNVSDDQGEFFRGLATPAMTVAVISFPFVMEEYPEAVGNINVLYGLTLILSLLMVAPVRMLNLKFQNFSVKENIFRYLLLVAVVVEVVQSVYMAGVPIIMAYIILSLISNAVSPKK